MAAVGAWGSSDPSGLMGDAADEAAAPAYGGGNTLEIPQQQAQFSPFSPSSAAGGLGDILGSMNPGAFDPTALGMASGAGGSTDILSLLSGLLGGSSGGGMGGIGSLLGGGSAIGGELAQLLGPLFGINQGGSSAMGGEIGGLAGGALGSIFGPLGSLGGSALGDLLGNLIGGGIGGGIPEMAKPQGLVNLLKGSGNTNEELLGRYIQSQGINKGFDLSGSNVPFNPRRFGDVIELLSGQGLPTQVGGNVGFKNPVELSGWKNLPALQAMVPNATTLTSNQLSQIFPEIALLVNKGGEKRGGLPGLLRQENQLATKLQAAESY